MSSVNKPFYSSAELRVLARENYIGIYVGTLASLVFQGYVMSLMFSYIQQRAKLPEKFVITACFVLGIFLSCIDMYQVFEIGVTHFTDMKYVFEIKWTEGVNAILTGIIHATTQGFFAARLVKLSDLRWWYGLPLSKLIAAGLAPSIGTGVRLLSQDRQDLQVFRANLMPWNYARYATGTFLGLALTASSALVLRNKAKGSTTRAVTAWEKIAFYTVHAMVLPTVACILSLILRGALPRSTIHDFPMHCLSKVSLLVLLQMLLARDQIRPDMRADPETTKSDEGVSRSFPSSGSESYPSAHRNSRINSSKKRLNIVQDPSDGEEDDLHKTPSRRTDLDSVEAGRYQQQATLQCNDEVIDIAKPSEVHKF